MNHLNKKLLVLLMGVVILSLSACGRIRDVFPDFNNESPSTEEAGKVEDYSGLLKALQGTGAQVSTSGSIEQPFFPVTGQVLEVNGSQVQVFEFADQSSRRQVSETISASGDQIGTSLPNWIEQPNFWASERLIVLYIGREQSVIDLLTSVLGKPITAPGEAGSLPPKAVLDGQRALAEELEISINEVQLVEVEQVDWPDGCLGLGKPDEACLAMITPGWRAIFEVGGSRYEVRTDENGNTIRWRELGEIPDSGVRESTLPSQAFMYLVALESTEVGDVIGCGDSLVPVRIKVQDEVQPIKNALSQLLAVDDQYYGESGFYNALYQSDLQVDSVMLDSSGMATVNLSGEIMLGGECDVPRVKAQLERTVLQFQSVNAVVFYLNGEPFEQVLSSAGMSEKSISYEGIRFKYLSTLAEEVDGATVPAESAKSVLPFIDEIPEHIQFEFNGYRDEKSSIKPQLVVVSVDELRQTQPGAGNLIALLRTVMAIKPELILDYLNLLPFVNASDMMFAQVQSVEFQNGVGVRFLTQYNPTRQPINNQQLFYTYQGLTDDGNYYVAAILPVSSSVLPDTPSDISGAEQQAFESDYPAYLADTTHQLDSASASSFNPKLSTLDDMIGSLEIQR